MRKTTRRLHVVVSTLCMLGASSVFAGCAVEDPSAPDEPIGEAHQPQIDPGLKDYTIYTMQQSGVTIGKILVTATANGSYAANREYWYLGSNVNTGIDLTFVGSDSMAWSDPPSGLGTLSFTTLRTPDWSLGTPSGTMQLETSGTERIGLKWQITYVRGAWTGSMTWWHSNKNNVFGPNTTNTLSVGTPAEGTWYHFGTSPL